MSLRVFSKHVRPSSRTSSASPVKPIRLLLKVMTVCRSTVKIMDAFMPLLRKIFAIFFKEFEFFFLIVFQDKFEKKLSLFKDVLIFF